MGRGALEAILGFFAYFAKTPWTRRSILVVNLGGIAYGFWYYLPQFAVTPAVYWPFVPDSPLAVLWATAALVAFEMRRRSPALEGLAFAGNVVIGLWTAFVLLYYGRVVPGRLDFVLFWLHLGMVGLALIFVQGLRDGPRRDAGVAVGAASLWYGANVWLDYWFTAFRYEGCAGLHPITIHSRTSPCAGLDVVAVVTVALTVAAVATLALLVLPNARRPASAGSVEERARAPEARRP